MSKDEYGEKVYEEWENEIYQGFTIYRKAAEPGHSYTVVNNDEYVLGFTEESPSAPTKVALEGAVGIGRRWMARAWGPLIVMEPR